MTKTNAGQPGDMAEIKKRGRKSSGEPRSESLKQAAKTYRTNLLKEGKAELKTFVASSSKEGLAELKKILGKDSVGEVIDHLVENFLKKTK